MRLFVHSLTHLFNAFLHLQLGWGYLEVRDFASSGTSTVRGTCQGLGKQGLDAWRDG